MEAGHDYHRIPYWSRNGQSMPYALYLTRERTPRCRGAWCCLPPSSRPHLRNTNQHPPTPTCIHPPPPTHTLRPVVRPHFAAPRPAWPTHSLGHLVCVQPSAFAIARRCFMPAFVPVRDSHA